MDSHIQIPKVVFKEFTNKDKYFFKYDVETKRISKGFPKATYTQENYYSSKIEGALNKYVETPMKSLLKYARELPSKSVFIIEDEILRVAKVYFKSLIARSPLIHKSFVENRVHLQFLLPQEKHDLAVSCVMDDKLMNRFDDEYDFTFMVNETEIPFVIPTRGLYEFSINGIQCINVPLTPWCALLLKEKGKHILGEKTDNVAVIISQSLNDIIHRLNGFAFEKQMNDGIGYVVCYDKRLLERYKGSQKTTVGK